MMAVATSQKPARLGALELLELGRTGSVQKPLNRPYLSGNRLGQLDFLKDVGFYLTAAFEFIFKQLGEALSVPLDILSSGVGVLFDGVAGLISNVPIIGEFASQLLLVGKSVIQWGLSVPGLLLEGIGNIFGEIKQAIDATRTPSEKASDEASAKDELLKRAEEKGGPALKKAVSDVLAGKKPDNMNGFTPDPIPDSDLPEGMADIGSQKTDLQKVLEIGLPVAAGTALLLVLVG